MGSQGKGNSPRYKVTDGVLWAECVASPNSCIEALSPNMLVIGDMAFGRVWGLDEVMRMGPHDAISVLTRKKETRAPFLFHVWGHSEKVAVHKPARGLSPGTKLAATFVLDFPAPTTMREKCLLFKPACLQVFWYGSLSWLRHLGNGQTGRRKSGWRCVSLSCDGGNWRKRKSWTGPKAIDSAG